MLGEALTAAVVAQAFGSRVAQFRLSATLAQHDRSQSNRRSSANGTIRPHALDIQMESAVFSGMVDVRTACPTRVARGDVTHHRGVIIPALRAEIGRLRDERVNSH